MLPSHVAYGTATMRLPGTRLSRKDDDLDSLTLNWQTDREDSFAPGFAPPDYPTFRIKEVETEEDMPGECYLHRLNCQGIKGERPSKCVRDGTRETLEGFDEGSEEWITLTPGDFLPGRIMTGHSNMVCVDVDKPRPWTALNFWKIRCNFRGIIGSKPTKRRIKVNEQIMQQGDGSGTAGGDFTVSLPGGWGTPHKGSVSLPKIVVSDCFVSTTPPPTVTIPGPLEPPDPPNIQTLEISGSAAELAKFTYHWPNGWKLADLDSDQIPGTSLYLITQTYEFVWPVTF